MKEDNVKIVLLPLEKILPNRFQPRIKFNEESIMELADSIKEHGVIQPIIVRTLGEKYEIVAGERRYKASVIAGIKEIPAILYDMNDKESAEIALIENVQRKDLSPIEQAISFKKILDMGYLTQSELASKIGVSQSALANKIRLLNLSDDVQEALLDEKISERHARSLLRITNNDDQAQMLKRVISKKLTVRALDDEIIYFLNNNKFKETPEENVKSEQIKTPVIEIKNNTDESFNDNTLNESIDEKNNQENIIDNNKEKIESIPENQEIVDKPIEEKNIEEKEDKENQREKTLEKEKTTEELEKKEEEKEEGEKSDTMNNSYDDINYNTLKNANVEHGKFLINTDDEPKEENNTSIFNFNNNNTLKDSPDIFKDLMAPQGSKNLFTNESNESIISNNTPSQESEGSSMFQGLMNASNNEKSEEVDDETLNRFLDPAFVDGTKQNIINNNNDNSSNVFSKFINDLPEENEEKSSIELPKEEHSVSNLLTPEVPTSMLFKAENSQVDNGLINNSEEDDSSDGNAKTITGLPSIFGTDDNVGNTNNIFSVGTSNNVIENNINNLQTNNTSSIFSNTDEQKPDLLAPMSDTGTGMSTPSIFEMNQQPANAVFDEEKNEITSIEEKEEPSVEEGFSLSSLNDIQTPVENKIEDEVKEEQTPVSFAQPSPIFITASSDSDSSFMPSSPIIDSDEKEEKSVPVVEETKEVIEPVNNISGTSEITETVEHKKEEPDVVGNQPIIVTDYNKQYDPIIPDAAPAVEKLDFKKILSLIRELSETIEKCGYEIDTDEIDLQDKYQVIFNINK